ncbi:hypothetical protein N0V83_009879 [Neocucurbitaria cava]|uniref:VASt domain-containing protein n=1 Tax=Neocucurbitaria cava TaxID=798079 RepID=A0A9W9CI54_9PLEO|nr:hypothetical protein N0V83_009879 [Neocucurbitaria cava]
MSAFGRRRSINSSVDQLSRDNSLAAPANSATLKSPDSSTVSIASSDNPSDDLRKSTDGAIDRLKSRNSEDGRSDTSSSNRRRMSRLFKGRKKRRQSGSQDDLSPSGSNEQIPPVPDIRVHGDRPNQSQESLGLAKSVASSLLTEDSDSEAPPVKRPGISPHQSHAGLLTLSSPLIASETIDSVDTADTALDNSVTSAEGASFQHANTIDTAANKRGVSPVGRLKEAFAPTQRSTPPKAGGDADSARPNTSDGGLGALFGGKKRETRVLDEPIQASPPQIHTGDETQSSTSLRSTAPKRIITQIPATPPNLHDAPTTLVTPPTPTDAKPASPTGSTSSKTGAKHTSTKSNPNVVVSPSGNMISHRRVRSTSNAPSKLSHSTTAPLTPHLEEAKTPGGTAVPPQSPGGFFASIFSAAQNAANNLTDTIANNATAKNKTNQQQQKDDDKRPEDGGEEVIGPESADPTTDSGTEKRRPAVETLGSGNLSLAQLGILESNEVSPMSSATNVTMKADEASANVEDMAAAQAVSAAYAGEKPPSTAGERPRSLTAVSGQSAGATSPPRQIEITDSPAASSIQRQGSIRSRISGGRRRRHRGSSATTGNTIGAIISASTTTLAPNIPMNGNRLNGTGFAVASPKRNRDFHNLFKSVPEDDYLIEDYSAALQKEILLHGRLYVSEGHLCFSSNILGWVTNLVISFDEVVSVEKKSTAVLFPNAIVISTLHARNVFASFLSRDSTYDLIIGIWKISHPNLKSSLNGVALDGSATGDKTEKAESIGSDEGSEQDSDDEVYDEDAEEDDGIGSFTEAGEGSVAGSEAPSVPGETNRKVSGAVAQAVGGGGETMEAAKAATSGATNGADFPGSTTHGPTECGDNDQHYDKLLIDTTIPAPLGKVYSLMFGPASGVFMRKWLIEDQRSSDLQMEDDKKGLNEDKKSFSYSYIKPLSAPVGPRQTKCNISMALEQFDLEKAVSVQCSTGTPDVPSGNIFLTKTRYCLMWGPGNSTRLIMTFTVEWSGKSWLRGPIEKGANDGQMSYATSLTAALRTAVSAKPVPLRVPGKGGKPKRRSKANILDEAPTPATAPSPTNQVKQSNWGLLDPLRSLLGPVADILESLFTPQIIITILGALLIYSWYFRGGSTAVGPNQWSNAQRQVAYEEIWRHEESELWNWLEDRVALDRVHSAVAARGRRNTEDDQDAQARFSLAENMKEREMDEAIKVTEERLQALKQAVDRKRAKTRTKSLKEEQT